MSGTTGDPKIDSIIRYLYTYLNELEKSLPQTGSSVPTNIQGGEGSIRIVNKGNDLYVVAVKSKDGWLVSDTTTFTFKTNLD